MLLFNIWSNMQEYLFFCKYSFGVSTTKCISVARKYNSLFSATSLKSPHLQIIRKDQEIQHFFTYHLTRTKKKSSTLRQNGICLTELPEIILLCRRFRTLYTSPFGLWTQKMNTNNMNIYMHGFAATWLALLLALH